MQQDATLLKRHHPQAVQTAGGSVHFITITAVASVMSTLTVIAQLDGRTTFMGSAPGFCI